MAAALKAATLASPRSPPDVPAREDAENESDVGYQRRSRESGFEWRDISST